MFRNNFFITLVLSFFMAAGGVQAFAPLPHNAGRTTTMQPSLRAATTDDKETRFFTGGALDKMEPEAAKIASRIKSVKELGWTGPPKRRGSARPKNRAWSQNEKPVQLKPNYDESNPKCVEKWLTQEEFYEKVRDSSPAADTVFVALAGGAAFAERDVVEKKLSQWRSGGKFNEDAFLKSVQQGRLELGLGWTVFLSLNALFVPCLVVPTNPLAQALVAAIGQVKDTMRPPEMI